jgi:hypothetical protein
MALDKYNMDGQELYNQYGMLSDDYSREYGAWNDKYGRLMDALGIAKGDYYDGANMFYTEQTNKNNVAGKEFDDAMSIWKGETDNAWKKAEWDEAARQRAEDIAYRDKRDSIEDAQWQKQFDAVYGNKTTGDSSGESSGGYTPPAGLHPSGGAYNNGSLSSSQIKELQKALGVTADGMYGSNSQKAAGGLSAEEAYKKYVGKKGEGGGFTGKTYDDATAYMNSKGVSGASVSGLMTSSEWNRRKSSYQAFGQGGTEVKEFKTYQEYLKSYVEYAVGNK